MLLRSRAEPRRVLCNARRGACSAACAVFLRYLFKALEVVVPVVIENHQLVVLFKLAHERVVILYLLYGRGHERVLGVLLAYVLLKEGQIYYNLVKAVFRHAAKLVAERVAQVALGERGVGERVTDWHSPFVKRADSVIDKRGRGSTRDSPAAVP